MGALNAPSEPIPRDPSPRESWPAEVPPQDRATADRELARGLQLAYSGELGAIRAYMGHRLTLRVSTERNAITRILKDEIRHRTRIREMLDEIDVAPDRWAEWKLNVVGRAIALSCLVLGWFAPIYGAARLENANIIEYEILARLAYLANRHHWIDDLLTLAEVEWDHELVLRRYASRHWLWRVAPHWSVPAPREQIRLGFEAWTRQPDEVRRKRAWVTR